jgi:hypothetical protein
MINAKNAKNAMNARAVAAVIGEEEAGAYAGVILLLFSASSAFSA